MKISVELLGAASHGVPFLSDANTIVLILVSLLTLIIAYQRFRSDIELQDKTDKALRRLLNTQSSPFIPFRIIRHHVGGFDDDDLRQHLVRAGAVRFADQNMIEHWSLLGRIPRRERGKLTDLVVPVSGATPSIQLFPAAKAMGDDI